MGKETKKFNINQAADQSSLRSIERELGSVQDQFNNTWYVKIARKLKMQKLAEKFDLLNTIPRAFRGFIKYVDPAVVAKSVPERAQVMRVYSEHSADMAIVRMEDYLYENGTVKKIFGKAEEN